MNKKIFSSIVFGLIVVSPLLASAVDSGSFQATISNYITYVKAGINFLLVLATLVFLWGIVKYITAGGDAGKITEARTYILWGLIGLAIMGSVWVLVNWLTSTIGVGTENKIPKDIYQQ